MKKPIAIGMATVLILVLMIGIGPVQAAEPPPDTPGAWIIYPDSIPDHWVGNDRHSDIWGSDLHTSIHEALGYSGQLLYPGPNNDDIGYWEFYKPPPEGSIIELRGPGVWDIGGDGAQGGQGREKQKSLVVQQNGITIRGQDYDDGTGNMVQQEILFNNGATTALFYLEASDLTIENLHISGTWPTNSGGYALAIGRYTMIGPDPNATGLTVTGNNFNNLRAMFDQQPTVADLTVVGNTVTDTYYNIFKKGVTFTGDNNITGNTFNQVGEGKSYPALQVLGHTGTTCIDYNTFDGWGPGQYAIGVQYPLDSPIGIGESNVFVDQVGGSGAGYEMCPLTSGGNAVGAPSVDDITGCAAADDEGPITTNVVATPNPVKVSESVTVTATVDDSTTGGSNIASAEYSLDDGATWSPMDASDGAFDEVSEDVEVSFYAPNEAGIYDLCVRGTDEHDNEGDPECIMLVVYDPEGGFVTGGGWIDSPPGALPGAVPCQVHLSGNSAEMSWGGYTGYMDRDIAAICDPNNSPVTFTGTVDVIGLQDNGAVMVGLIDKKWLDEGNTGYMGGAYTYFGRRGQNLVIGPTDGNLGGEIIQTFITLTGYFDVPEPPPVSFETTIYAGSISVSSPGGTCDDYGVVKTLNNDSAYEWDEFQFGAYVGIDSWPPENAVLYDVTVEGCGCQLSGKATFGFVSKYNKKTELAEGNTEFVFKAADLNFHSSSYDWLVVTGSDYAKFKGTGTINGEGSYKFMLWAGDGTGTDGADTFRIKIWEEDGSGNETVIYDNGMDQAIGGGSIVVHTSKK